MSEDKDVGQVLARLKEEVRRGSTATAGASPWPQAPTLRRLYATTHVNPHLPIGWPRLPRGILPKLVAIVQKLIRRGLRWYINPIVEQQNAYNAAATATLESLLREMEQQRGERQAALEKLDAVWLRLRHLERQVQQPVPGPAAAAQSNAGLPATGAGLPLDYFGLEWAYRGPRMLQARQRGYLKYFEGQHNVLDIGCGRGEFVELLQQSDISARGIDLDPASVAYAQERGLPVELAEGVSYLEKLPSQSLGGVFASQVVEHLHPTRLVRMLELAQDRLAPGAPIVLETINPACVWALSNWFVMDPTHVWPVHAETLKFLLQSSGFQAIEVDYLNPVPAEQALQIIPDQAALKGLDPEATLLLNNNINRLNGFLFGYQDYAVIAHRPVAGLEGGQ